VGECEAGVVEVAQMGWESDRIMINRMGEAILGLK
jgi:hypothetical protein